MQRHRRLVIDMTGWSRGAVIVGTVALDLSTVRFFGNDYEINLQFHQQIDVHWVGLFDAVEQMRIFGVNGPNHQWATAFSGNVHYHLHLIHTNHQQDGIFPTAMGFNPQMVDFLVNGDTASTHRDVGTNFGALVEMISGNYDNSANAWGVPLD